MTKSGAEWSWRSVLGLLVLVCVLEVSVSQHWSYGWLPGGKRSVGELEATFRMMDAGDAVVALPLESPLEQITPLQTTGVQSLPGQAPCTIPIRVLGQDSQHHLHPPG
ncbi:hypothetical protein MHYP_G00143130 [Metynnis hypsauchen]